MPNFATSGGAPGVVKQQACIVFDSASGEVRGVHEVITLDGGAPTSDQEVADRALELARERAEICGLPTGGLETAMVDPARLEGGAPVSVEPDGELVFAPVDPC